MGGFERLRALLLSAGLGTRLMPITKTVPKCLIEIDSKPLLSYWLDNLDKLGVDEIFINTHYLSDLVQEYIDNSIYKKKITLIKEKKLFGTGGTLKNNADLFKDQSLLLIHSDNLCLTDFDNFLNSHTCRNLNIVMTMMTFFCDNPKECGIVEVDHNQVLKSFYEKVALPPSNLANGAVFIIEPELTNFVKHYPKEIFDISKDIIPVFLNQIKTWHNNFYHRDIGNIISLENVNKDLHYIKKLIDYFNS